MAICVPKRIYSEESLSSWLEKLESEWESQFSKQELSLGREIYRNGEIRELEVNEYDAIVHAKFDQDECYALIEWNKGNFSVRGSSEDKLLGRALAAAGLYDIEELVSEEASQLPPEAKKKQEEKADLISALLKQRKNGNNKVEQGRDLLLEFKLQGKGIRFRALWYEDGKDPVLALKSEHYIPGDTNATERERLIGLASLSRKSGFKFKSKEGHYYLDGVEKVLDFYSGDFKKKWDDKFKLSLTPGVLRLKQGLQSAQVLIDLEASDPGYLDFCWRMEVDNTILEPEQARALIKNTGKPVLLDNLGVVLLEEDKVDLLATWRRWLNLYSDGRIPRYSIFSLFGEEPIKLTLSKELKNWRDSLSAMPTSTGIKLPKFLRSYQEQGVKWLSHLCEKNCHGLLADEMGLGKTVQVLSFLNSRQDYKLPNLIVCPASVVPVWEREIKRFFPHMKIDILKSGNDFYECKDEVLWLASYAQLRMHRYLLRSVNFGYVVLDEAQLIKNPDAKVTQACMCIDAKHRIVLTGTPLENRYLDLWSIFRFLMPGLLGTRKRFEEQVVKHGSKIGQRIKKQIAPFVLRRTKADVLKELPEKTEVDCLCPLTAVQKEEYRRLSLEGVKDLGNDIPKAVKERSLSFLTLLTRLRQVSCDPALLPWMDTEIESSGKVNVLMEKLSEILAGGSKVVIFSQFVTMLDRVRGAMDKYFEDIPVFELTGKTVDRAKPVNSFQELEGAGVILVSLRAGGTGITLHTADYVFLMDPWWNPAVEDQAIDRVHRLGQDKPVFVYRMITAGTIEARIQNLKNEKKGIFDGVLGGMSDISNMKNYFNTLSQLVELLPDDK